jgi:hypothetical protein
MTTQIAGEVGAFFAGAVPDAWFTGAPDVNVDADEILVVGPLAEPELTGDVTETERVTAARARIKRFREDTREKRMAIAEDAQHKFQRTVSWGASCGDQRIVFTNLSVPVMTRLRLPERTVLDTLVAAGVARSRSDALGWCVRLVGKHESDWLKDLNDALVHVERVRSEGPRPI